MKRFIIGALIVGVVATFSAAIAPETSAAPATPKDPFVGAWTGIDEVDGSNMWLVIGRGLGRWHPVLWQEDYFTACEGEPGTGFGSAFTDRFDQQLVHVRVYIVCWTRGETITADVDLNYRDNDTLGGGHVVDPPGWERLRPRPKH
jgi:hypothetical protein